MASGQQRRVGSAGTGTTFVTRTDHRLDVSAALPGGTGAELAVTVFAGADETRPSADAGQSRVVAFAYPGGGYTRGYYDLRHPALPGPGQADYHGSRGWVVVTCDPLGAGDSTPLDDAVVTLDASARAADLAARDILGRLRDGTLREDLRPLPVAAAIGIGHSLGGMQLIHQQAAFQTFDAIAVLGFSAVHTIIPTPGEGVLAPARTQASVTEAWSGPLSDDIEHLRYAYHWDDVPGDLVAEDMSAGFPVRTADPLPPWISATFPPFAAVCMAPGVVAGQAAAVDVPVFVGGGERDVLPDLRAEAAAYAASPDITLRRVRRCAHMHNFSPQRRDLWQRLHLWGESVPLLTDRVPSAPDQGEPHAPAGDLSRLGPGQP
jgi:hypothetical protein